MTPALAKITIWSEGGSGKAWPWLGEGERLDGGEDVEEAESQHDGGTFW